MARCTCASCATGKCQCEECRPGPGIDFKGRRVSATLLDEIRRDVRNERLKLRDLRAPHVERQLVRRWGDIIPAQTLKEDQDKDQERGDHGTVQEDGSDSGSDV